MSKKGIIFTSILMLVIMVAIACIYFFYINYLPTTEPDEATSFATFFSNMTMPFLTLITVISFLVTLKQQQENLTLIKEQSYKQAQKELFQIQLDIFEKDFGDFIKRLSKPVANTGLTIPEIVQHSTDDFVKLIPVTREQLKNVLNLYKTANPDSASSEIESNIYWDIFYKTLPLKQLISELGKALKIADYNDRKRLQTKIDELTIIIQLINCFHFFDEAEIDSFYKMLHQHQ